MKQNTKTRASLHLVAQIANVVSWMVKESAPVYQNTQAHLLCVVQSVL